MYAHNNFQTTIIKWNVKFQSGMDYMLIQPGRVSGLTEYGTYKESIYWVIFLER